MSVPVSVVIPVKNEGANLARCLESIRWADEIYVVDSQSDDQTGAIAEAAGARLVQFNFHGDWPKKKEWALRNIAFRHDWVLLLDADEVMAPDAGSEIAEKIANSPEEVAGYWINRQFMFLGRWLRHAYYPNWNLRLFRHAHAKFERLVQGDSQSGDVEIHEHVLVTGQTGKLRTELRHYAFPTVASFVEKHNRYSNWEALLEVEAEHSSFAPQLDRVNWRRRIKSWSRRLPGRPFLRFFYVYILQAGWRDGLEGYYFAQLHAAYEWMSLAKAYELKKKGQGPRKQSNESSSA